MYKAGIGGEWEHQRPFFIKNHEDPFLAKWKAIPAPVNLLRSPDHYRRFYATVNGLMGIIPVYPWTTQKEIEQHARRIHRQIGTTHKNSTGDRRIQIAKWLSQPFHLRKKFARGCCPSLLFPHVLFAPRPLAD